MTNYSKRFSIYSHLLSCRYSGKTSPSCHQITHHICFKVHRDNTPIYNVFWILLRTTHSVGRHDEPQIPRYMVVLCRHNLGKTTHMAHSLKALRKDPPTCTGTWVYPPEGNPLPLHLPPRQSLTSGHSCPSTVLFSGEIWIWVVSTKNKKEK
jgi:hypothetical protein